METNDSLKIDTNNFNFMFVDVKREPKEIFNLTETEQFHRMTSQCSKINGNYSDGESNYKKEPSYLGNLSIVKKEENDPLTENPDYVDTEVSDCIDKNFEFSISTQSSRNEIDYGATRTKRRIKPFSLSTLTKHVDERDAERRHTCEICKKVFTARSNMLKHVRSHTEERNYKCEICTKLFKSNDNMSRHMKRHTEVSNYTCDVCSKSFKMRQYMLEHSKSHTEERKYKCEICTMSFKTNQIMSRHMKTHTIAKQKCAICSKSLKSRSMSRHMKLHTKDVGNKELACNVGQVRKDYLQEEPIKAFNGGLKEEMETDHMLDANNALRTTITRHTKSSHIKVKLETEIVYLPQIIEFEVKNEPSNNSFSHCN